MTPLVLIHGGGFAASCWDLLLPHLDRPALAVDLPGRGGRAADLRTVTLADCAAAVAEDVDRAGYDEVVLVGHSLAGCSMPGVAGLLGDRVRHLVFVSCTVPEDGTSTFDTLEPELQAMSQSNEGAGTLEVAVARAIFGNDLTDAQFDRCLADMVPEAPGLITDRVDLAPLRTSVPRTWVRLLRDVILPPVKQGRFIANVGGCEVVDIDTGHMVMYADPAALAGVLAGIEPR
ncbi:MAG: esterase [Actinomycetia bacterium]|nr:esterase [Actinomycetes bacterium]